jgi:transcriptional regulator with XRE-family HTH domain
MSTDFSRTLSLLRKEKSISQRTAAADLGISQALLSHYENGIREPGLSFVVRACDYYHVSADYLLGRTMCKDGAMIDTHELYDVSEHKDNALRGSVMAQLSKKLLVNSISMIYGLLGKLGSRELIVSVSNYLDGALYNVFRFLYSANKSNPNGIFALSETEFHAGALDSSMMRAKYDMIMELDHLSSDKAVTDKLHILNAETMKQEYPALYQSMLQLLHSTNSRLKQELAGKVPDTK